MTRDLEDSTIYKHSAGGLVIHDGKVLTLSWTDKEFICFPKGGLEFGETPEQAAIREISEETGYTVEPIKFLGSWEYSFKENGVKFHKRVDYFAMKLVNSNEKPNPRRQPGENFVNLWLSIEDAKAKLTYNDAQEALDLAIKP